MIGDVIEVHDLGNMIGPVAVVSIRERERFWDVNVKVRRGDNVIYFGHASVNLEKKSPVTVCGIKGVKVGDVVDIKTDGSED